MQGEQHAGRTKRTMSLEVPCYAEWGSSAQAGSRIPLHVVGAHGEHRCVQHAIRQFMKRPYFPLGDVLALQREGGVSVAAIRRDVHAGTRAIRCGSARARRAP
jgi:hypothetical protein